MKQGQLTLTAYVFLMVFLIFTLACVYFLWPLINTAVSTDPSYSTGTEKYALYLIPAVLVIGAIVSFFIPNTVVRGQ